MGAPAVGRWGAERPLKAWARVGRSVTTAGGRRRSPRRRGFGRHVDESRGNSLAARQDAQQQRAGARHGVVRGASPEAATSLPRRRRILGEVGDDGRPLDFEALSLRLGEGLGAAWEGARRHTEHCSLHVGSGGGPGCAGGAPVHAALQSPEVPAAAGEFPAWCASGVPWRVSLLVSLVITLHYITLLSLHADRCISF